MDEEAKMALRLEAVLGDFFYFVGVLFIFTKVLEYFIERRVAQLAEEE